MTIWKFGKKRLMTKKLMRFSERVKKMKYDVRRYNYTENEMIDEFVMIEGSGYLVYIYSCMGIDYILLTEGESWCEGSDELVGVYETREEAEDVIKKYFR